MRFVLAALLVAATVLLAAVPATATTGKGQLFHDGSVVGTVVTPSPIATGSGTNPFYNLTNGAAGQLGIAVSLQATAPITAVAGRSIWSPSRPGSRRTC